MKLFRAEMEAGYRACALDAHGNSRDLTPALGDLSSQVIASGALGRLKGVSSEAFSLVRTPYCVGPCVRDPGKIVCIGLNYRDHALEAGLAVPTEPVVFLKATSSLAAPIGTLSMPRGATKVDWEAELAVVIGKTAKHVSESTALAHVAGYCLMNDVSERSFQLERGGQWSKGKSADGFAPLGPWLVTADEVPDPQALNVWLDLNDERMQEGNTREMIFPVAYLISYISQFMTLLPGDIVSTGTPAGIGMGRHPPRFLRGGDRIAWGITGLGEQRLEVIDAPCVTRAEACHD